MKKSLFYVIPFFLIIFSCGKQPLEAPDENPIPKLSCRINYVDMSYNGGDVQSCTIGYDTDKNISRVVSTQDSAFISFSVLKSLNQIVLKTKYSGDWTYQLDDKQKVIIAHEFYDYTFTYNADGNLSTARVVEDPTHITSYVFFYDNGNLSRIIGENSGYNTAITIDFTYDLGKTASTSVRLADPISYIGLYEVLPGFFGKVSKNKLLTVIKKERNKTYGFGSSERYYLGYSANENNQLSKIIVDRVYGDLSVNNVETLSPKDNLTYNF
ncbi:hypothetical protein EZ449_08270 [Pedobacter frigidisoli]|uniref:YD repeat-containing protein n=1 Tax=Pedobacter frigidisoli TaxID=2530455 RepID=A0A4R0P511_9SPHI|nr:hypothetical protein [Pedobacter frigidisoli]TCD10864.1 hypothetical protein EZ449_08270 [Pedobacter frigidisoli]